MSFTRLSLGTGGLAIGILALSLATPYAHAQNKDSDKISSLLSSAKIQAMWVAQDADTLQSYTMSPMTWESHASELRLISSHLDELTKITMKLNDARPEGSPWQQTAIDRINPLMGDLGESVSTTIRLLSSRPELVNMPPYRDSAHANYDLADRTATLISDFVEYGKSKGTSQTLNKKLELPAPKH